VARLSPGRRQQHRKALELVLAGCRVEEVGEIFVKLEKFLKGSLDDAKTNLKKPRPITTLSATYNVMTAPYTYVLYTRMINAYGLEGYVLFAGRDPDTFGAMHQERLQRASRRGLWVSCASYDVAFWDGSPRADVMRVRVEHDAALGRPAFSCAQMERRVRFSARIGPPRNSGASVTVTVDSAVTTGADVTTLHNSADNAALAEAGHYAGRAVCEQRQPFGPELQDEAGIMRRADPSFMEVAGDDGRVYTFWPARPPDAELRAYWDAFSRQFYAMGYRAELEVYHGWEHIAAAEHCAGYMVRCELRLPGGAWQPHTRYIMKIGRLLAKLGWRENPDMRTAIESLRGDVQAYRRLYAFLPFMVAIFDYILALCDGVKPGPAYTTISQSKTLHHANGNLELRASPDTWRDLLTIYGHDRSWFDALAAEWRSKPAHTVFHSVLVADLLATEGELSEPIDGVPGHGLHPDLVIMPPAEWPRD
jgi:hypothetical protein